eukprot:3846762-Amphidinium_carterae.1
MTLDTNDSGADAAFGLPTDPYMPAFTHPLLASVVGMRSFDQDSDFSSALWLSPPFMGIHYAQCLTFCLNRVRKGDWLTIPNGWLPKRWLSDHKVERREMHTTNRQTEVTGQEMKISGYVVRIDDAEAMALDMCLHVEEMIQRMNPCWAMHLIARLPILVVQPQHISYWRLRRNVMWQPYTRQTFDQFALVRMIEKPRHPSSIVYFVEEGSKQIILGISLTALCGKYLIVPPDVKMILDDDRRPVPAFIDIDAAFIPDVVIAEHDPEVGLVPFAKFLFNRTLKVVTVPCSHNSGMPLAFHKK